MYINFGGLFFRLARNVIRFLDETIRLRCLLWGPEENADETSGPSLKIYRERSDIFALKEEANCFSRM